jgi:hypothetical protein
VRFVLAHLKVRPSLMVGVLPFQRRNTGVLTGTEVVRSAPSGEYRGSDGYRAWAGPLHFGNTGVLTGTARGLVRSILGIQGFFASLRMTTILHNDDRSSE